ncbi:hypothetical protein LSAT2_015124 [Lamellibrachia satsuma]|nr:hypothetical protein LSAT2_015124 [Lamellibrachia satsuma]
MFSWKGSDISVLSGLQHIEPSRRIQSSTKCIVRRVLINYGKPKIYEEENKALLYGSLDMPSNQQTAKPVRDPFHEKTSAELKKFRAVQVEAEKEINKYKHEKIQKAKDREDEKKKDLAMLKRYDPWGRPGGGAPNKGGSSSSERLSQSPHKDGSDTHRSFQDDLNEEYGNFHASFGKPGGGAPLKTLSGELKTEIKSDVAIHFQDTKTGRVEAEQEFRYKNPRYDKLRYSQDLEKQIKSKSLSHKELRLQELRTERETLSHEPYGKPGGGAPNMSETRLLENANTNKYLFDPWGKGVGQPHRDTRGEVLRHKFSDSKFGMEKLVQNGDRRTSELGVSLIMSDHGGGGAPLKTHSGQVKSRLPITIKRTPFGDNAVAETVRLDTNDPELQPYDPWGRAGAGAPVFDSNGKPIPNIYGRIQREKESATPRQKAHAAHAYLQELRKISSGQDLRDYLPAYVSVYVSVQLRGYLPAYVFVYVSVQLRGYLPAYVFVYVSVQLRGYLPAYVSVYVTVQLRGYLPAYVSVYVSVQLRGYLPAYVSVYASVQLRGYLPAYVSVYVSVQLHSYLLAYVSVYVSVQLRGYLPAYVCVYLPAYVSVYVSVQLRGYLPAYVSVYVYVQLRGYLPAYVSVYVSVQLRGYLPVYVSVSIVVTYLRICLYVYLVRPRLKCATPRDGKGQTTITIRRG